MHLIQIINLGIHHLKINSLVRKKFLLVDLFLLWLSALRVRYLLIKTNNIIELLLLIISKLYNLIVYTIRHGLLKNKYTVDLCIIAFLLLSHKLRAYLYWFLLIRYWLLIFECIASLIFLIIKFFFIHQFFISNHYFISLSWTQFFCVVQALTDSAQSFILLFCF
jgi:hypothetical protein